MAGTYTARLADRIRRGDSQHHEQQSGLLLVSPDATTAGTTSVDIPVANGTTDASYFIHGVEGAQGTVTLTATATRFTEAQGRATVGEPPCNSRASRR